MVVLLPTGIRFIKTINIENMYSTKTAKSNNGFESSYMEVGINNNVELQNVEVLTSPQGKDFIKFTFEKDGKTVNFTEWKNEKNMWIKTDEDLQNRDDLQFGRILQLINCFFEETPDFEGNSFKEMINWVKLQLEQGMKNNKKLRLKVVYDKNGYTTVSKYGTYVESMDIKEEDSQIKLFKNDLLERPIVADKEPAADPFTQKSISVTENNIGADDLPF